MALPATMRALLLKNDGYARSHSGTVLEAMAPYVEAGEIDVPEPGPRQVLVKVKLASINPSDVMFVKGLYGQPRKQGQPAGFEGVGEVVSAGDDPAAKALAGQRVAFATGLSNWGSWAEYAVAEAGACIPLIPALRDEDGAAMIVNPLTALAMFGIVKDAGEKAFIVTAGASQLCKLIIAVAREEGYRPIAIVRRDDQIELLKQHGAAHVLNATEAGFARQMAAVCKEENPRILLDAVSGPVASTVFHAMGKGARWVVYGRLDASDTVIREPGQFIFMDKKIEGFWLTQWMRNAGTERRMAAVMEAQNRFADGRWKTDVTAVVPLDDAMERVAGELAKPNGKVFIAP
ncbi:MAG: zinc-binding dehydrogenase [Rhizobiaceae bacterium]|nr:zinc-binding dehydrogenase [Rhizobiaceae bacterium]